MELLIAIPGNTIIHREKAAVDFPQAVSGQEFTARINPPKFFSATLRDLGNTSFRLKMPERVQRYNFLFEDRQATFKLNLSEKAEHAWKTSLPSSYEQRRMVIGKKNLSQFPYKDREKVMRANFTKEEIFNAHYRDWCHDMGI